MDHQTALPILRALADGQDPYTGTPLPPGGAYQHADTVRALHLAITALQPPAPAIKKPARAAQSGKGNTGKPWTGAEDQRLLDGFDAGEPVTALAARHERSTLAIEARLARFGRVPMPSGLRMVAPARPAESVQPS